MKNCHAFLKHLTCLTVLIISFVFAGFKADVNTTAGWETWTNCMVPVKKEWNKNCTGNYFIQWKNTCTEPMDIKYAFQRTDGKWISGVIQGIKPGEIRGGSACTATGKYYLWARPTRIWLETKFPTDDQIKAGTIPEPNKKTITPPVPPQPTSANNSLASCNASIPDILISETGDHYMKSGDGCLRKITPEQYARYKQLKTPEEKKRHILSCTGDTMRIRISPLYNNGN